MRWCDFPHTTLNFNGDKTTPSPLAVRRRPGGVRIAFFVLFCFLCDCVILFPLFSTSMAINNTLLPTCCWASAGRGGVCILSCAIMRFSSLAALNLDGDIRNLPACYPAVSTAAGRFLDRTRLHAEISRCPWVASAHSRWPIGGGGGLTAIGTSWLHSLCAKLLQAKLRQNLSRWRCLLDLTGFKTKSVFVLKLLLCHTTWYLVIVWYVFICEWYLVLCVFQQPRAWNPPGAFDRFTGIDSCVCPTLSLNISNVYMLIFQAKRSLHLET